jgi:hypothetical protein
VACYDRWRRRLTASIPIAIHQTDDGSGTEAANELMPIRMLDASMKAADDIPLAASNCVFSVKMISSVSGKLMV